MDITPFLELKPAPKVLFDALPAWKSRPRFMLSTPDGDWRTVTWGAYAKGIRNAALFLASLERGGEASTRPRQVQRCLEPETGSWSLALRWLEQERAKVARPAASGLIGHS